MNQTIQEILEALHALTVLYRELAAHSLQKQEAIIANRAEQVAAITRQEGKLSQSIAEQDRLREEAVRRFALAAGLPGAPAIRVEQLIRLVHQVEPKQALTAAAAELSAALQEMKKVNDANQELMRLHLDYINFSMDLIAGPSEDEATYHHSLQDRGFRRTGQFDAKA